MMETLINLDSYDTYKTVMEEIMKTLHKSEQKQLMGIECNVIVSAKNEIRKLITSSNYDISEVVKKIIKKNWESERTQYLISILESNKNHILYSIILYQNSVYNDTITNHNWYLKLVLGTSDLKVLRYPLLQLEFSSVNASGLETQRVYDLTKDSLSKLIKVVENCIDTK
ncbi:unnamed protein product [Diatraea saccharalis]|uniref:COMM domain-containing protein n=1 Tax=Diatraea saccharalis TaxID=40085 RepID=A0A9N9QXS1_9NEOP|nr:unnamed protein product [Diatraea saccharalis]